MVRFTKKIGSVLFTYWDRQKSYNIFLFCSPETTPGSLKQHYYGDKNVVTIGSLELCLRLSFVNSGLGQSIERKKSEKIGHIMVILSIIFADNLQCKLLFFIHIRLLLRASQLLLVWYAEDTLKNKSKHTKKENKEALRQRSVHWVI